MGVSIGLSSQEERMKKQARGQRGRSGFKMNPRRDSDFELLGGVCFCA